MLIAGGTRTLTRQYATPLLVVPVETDVIVADASFGGFVVGSVAMSDVRWTPPIPAASHVRSGVLLTAAANARPGSSGVAVGAASLADDPPPPPPQATSAAVAQSDAAPRPARIERRRDERMLAMEILSLSLSLSEIDVRSRRVSETRRPRVAARHRRA